MKKSIPLLFLVLSFTGFLSGQILWDIMRSEASHTSEEKNRVLYYDNILKNIKLTTTKGKTIDFSTESVVVLNFWASWCIPCLQELPVLNNIGNALNIFCLDYVFQQKVPRLCKKA